MKFAYSVAILVIALTWQSVTSSTVPKNIEGVRASRNPARRRQMYGYRNQCKKVGARCYSSHQCCSRVCRKCSSRRGRGRGVCARYRPRTTTPSTTTVPQTTTTTSTTVPETTTLTTTTAPETTTTTTTAPETTTTTTTTTVPETTTATTTTVPETTTTTTTTTVPETTTTTTVPETTTATTTTVPETTTLTTTTVPETTTLTTTTVPETTTTTTTTLTETTTATTQFVCPPRPDDDDPTTPVPCPKCQVENPVTCVCEPDPDAADDCEPCDDNAAGVSGEKICELTGLPNSFKCCPRTSNCKKDILPGRSPGGIFPTLSLVCSDNCGSCLSKNAEICTLGEPFALVADTDDDTDDVLDTCPDLKKVEL